MVANRVPGLRHLANDLRMALCGLAEHEERRARLMFLKNILCRLH